MTTELTIKNLLPTLTESKLQEMKYNISNTTFIGIDFGTSTTVVSIAAIQKNDIPIIVKSIEIEQKLIDGIYKSYLIPSAIAYFNGKILVGQGAADLRFKLRDSKNFWHSFKMQLGEDVGCHYPESELGKDSSIKILTAQEATKLFFKFVKDKIDQFVKQNNLPSHIEYAVSIPASFEANQRKDLINCLEANNIQINKQSLIDEPNAAFLSYVLESNLNNQIIKIPENTYPNILVFDFGAGTCDISILEIGQDNKGVYSKNIAISKFEKLGGNDIDKLIAIDVLLPQLLNNSGFTIENFKTRELNENIIPKLLKTAEKLKVQICNSVALQKGQKALPEIAKSSDCVSLGTVIEIDTKKGTLILENPKISIKQFAEIISLFTKTNSLLPTKRIEGDNEFVSIFNPINSALKKSKLKKEQIDYVLFIGGSSKNPFIQKAVMEYFNESEYLIPNDFQSHVSAGSAIHSLIYNGFNKNIIQPITSEPIILITTDNKTEIIDFVFEAGCQIPSELTVKNNLFPQFDGQKIIEIPVCIGNKNKILYNLKLYSPDDNGFKKSEPIKLQAEINADKLLLIRATAANKAVMVEPINPFANKDLTTNDRIKHLAEKEFRLSCARNGGEPTYEALNALHNAYEKIGLHFKAAETLEQISELFPKNANYNNIGLYYIGILNHLYE